MQWLFLFALCSVVASGRTAAVSVALSKLPTMLDEIRYLTRMDAAQLESLFKAAGLASLGRMIVANWNHTISSQQSNVGFPVPTMSAQCFSDLLLFAATLRELFVAEMPQYASSHPLKFISWSLKVVDAFGKAPSGFLYGNVWMLGSYDQCVKISQHIKEQDRFWEGQYCRYDMKFFQDVVQPSSSSLQSKGKCYDVSLKYGACLPSSCSTHDAQMLGQLLNATLGGVGCELGVTCHRGDENADGAFAVLLTTSFLIVVAFLLFFATLYDYYVVQAERGSPLKAVDGDSDAAALVDSGTPGSHNLAKQLPGNDKQSCTFLNVLLAFSLYTNTRKVITTVQPAGQLTCLNGIRVLSMLWIIFGHSYYWAIPYLNNIVYAYELPENVFNQILLNGSLSVDSFFFLGATLLAFVWMKKLKNKTALTRSPLFWVQYLAHRYLRVTPVYLIVLVVYAVLVPKATDGPMWGGRGGFNSDNCAASWWTNVLYVNNFFHLNNPCMSWTWYLAADMQYFILSAPLLVLFLNRELIAITVTVMLIVASAVVQIVLRMQNPSWPPIAIFSVNPKQFEILNAYWEAVYVKPYTRCGPFLVGLLFGYYMHKVKLSVKMSKPVVVLGWLTCTGAAVGLLFGLQEYSRHYEIDYAGMLIYAGFSRTIWAMVLAWISLACTTGYGGPINDFLSWKVWIPLSRLTYCLYLVHPILIQAIYASQSKPIHFSGHYQMVHYFFGHLVLSIIIAFVTSVSFEMPIASIEPLIFGHHPKKGTDAGET
uniref:NRF domain-containing protein n=1 Tax=Trichuris muris TaxID=70415 RepID=A0A5S6R5D4_TRIMR